MPKALLKKSCQMTVDDINQLGYSRPKLLATGEWAGLHPMIFTVGLFVGIDKNFYRTRYCYPDLLSAIKGLEEWDGHGDPPGPWIKQKPEDRSNPNNS